MHFVYVEAARTPAPERADHVPRVTHSVRAPEAEPSADRPCTATTHLSFTDVFQHLKSEKQDFWTADERPGPRTISYLTAFALSLDTPNPQTSAEGGRFDLWFAGSGRVDRARSCHTDAENSAKVPAIEGIRCKLPELDTSMMRRTSSATVLIRLQTAAGSPVDARRFGGRRHAAPPPRCSYREAWQWHGNCKLRHLNQELLPIPTRARSEFDTAMPVVETDVCHA